MGQSSNEWTERSTPRTIRLRFICVQCACLQELTWPCCRLYEPVNAPVSLQQISLQVPERAVISNNQLSGFA